MIDGTVAALVIMFISILGMFCILMDIAYQEKIDKVKKPLAKKVNNPSKSDVIFDESMFDD